VTLVGIDPQKEAKISFIGSSISQGRYLKPRDPRAIVIGEALLDKFETKIGNKLVLMSQDIHGDIASKAFRIVGTYRAEMEATEKQYVFVTREAAQEMLKLEERISEIAVLLPHEKQSADVAQTIEAALPDDHYEVHTWRELLPFVQAYLDLLDGFIYIWYLVVFIAMSFGIVNTTLMAVFERIREFGLLKALGMKPWWIIRGVLTESFILLLMGLLAGNSLAFLTIWAFSGNGIDLSAFAQGVEFAGMTRVVFPKITFQDWWVANITVMLLGLMVSTYPAAKAARFRPVEALAHT
jgi:ABC-type lipoprotein release transport system permease subunit